MWGKRSAAGGKRSQKNRKRGKECSFSLVCARYMPVDTIRSIRQRNKKKANRRAAGRNKKKGRRTIPFMVALTKLN